MAYDLSERFPKSPASFKLLEPGAYQNGNGCHFATNKVPFNSKSPRLTQPGNKVWTSTIYFPNNRAKIPECTSLKSKTPRFAHEDFGEKDLEDLLCRCGLSQVCECAPELASEPNVLCQGTVPRRLIIGNPPRSVLGYGLSIPSKQDKGFSVSKDGTAERVREEVKEESPPFYDTRVSHSSDYYKGCRWSRWTSKRTQIPLEQRPGPADYTLENQPSAAQQCQEKFRFLRRKTSKQLRFIEMIQQKNILDNQPGPASYSPSFQRETDYKVFGAKERRFPKSKFTVSPGPADHWIQRDFDLPKQPEKKSHFKYPAPAFFGVKAQRFRPLREEGPSPASYDPADKICKFIKCSNAPFGTSALRWKNDINDFVEDDYMDLDDKNEIVNSTMRVCPSTSWMFKSKSLRMKDLIKMFHEPSPADLPQQQHKISRKYKLQYLAPFCTSEGRFQPWHDWIPVFGMVKTPGPAYYDLEKPKCLPAVHHGPLFKSPRFPSNPVLLPAPNEYNVDGGIECILQTHNTNLRKNIEKKHKFQWKPPPESKVYSNKEKEINILNKCIRLLDSPDIFDNNNEPNPVNDENPGPKENDSDKPKLLRCFLYSKKLPNSI